MTEDELYKLESYIHEGGDCQYWAPHHLLELIDEIKRLRGLPVEKWPEDFLPEEPITPVEFDFSGVLDKVFNRRGG